MHALPVESTFQRVALWLMQGGASLVTELDWTGLGATTTAVSGIGSDCYACN